MTMHCSGNVPLRSQVAKSGVMHPVSRHSDTATSVFVLSRPDLSYTARTSARRAFTLRGMSVHEIERGQSDQPCMGCTPG